MKLRFHNLARVLPWTSMLCLAGSLSAQTVSWEKELDYSLAPGKNLSILGATAGTTFGSTVSDITLGYQGLTLNGRSAGTSITPDHFSAYTSPGDFTQLSLTFDHLLSGGSLLRVGSLDWVSDWEISVSGGNATLTNIGVAALASGTNTISPFGSITGNGTDTLLFHTSVPNDSIVSFDDYYNGGTGINITGTWDTITLRAYNPSPTSFGQSYDNLAGLTVSNAQVVPEPGSSLLIGSVGLLLTLRRRRQ